ncbi:O-antigen ligase family protein [Maribacter algarum]|uniref:O-antigen ligase family protein n=1 Tax=Maribacter algarum (ex Zhang et al. 2020) TaxID=2578118 RepID=A0A5S3PTA2_9FLAO|nr:O-antigen ligase family protein [Maribacter algarum]TMM58226.1 O-antigen ligase family protein [Maribacter algarum]
MIEYSDYFYFDLAEINITHFYIYFVFALLVASYLIFKSNSKHKVELFFISFYLLTGNLNNLLILKIPGLSLFEIQPIRLIYLLLGFLLLRKTFFSKNGQGISFKNTLPWYELALIGFLIFQTLSIVVNIFPTGLKVILDGFAFLIIIKGVGIMKDKASYALIGKSIIICAVITSIVAIIQLVIDPFFMRIGSARDAFGDVLRSNGIFSQEYHHSYYLIIAIAWVLTTVKKEVYKILLVTLFSFGVITSFMRMSWLVLALVLVTYFVYVRKTAIEKLMVLGLSMLALGLSVSIFYYQDIMNSALVKERLSDDIDGRKGYYTMVFNNYQKKPILGYGDRNNEVYYTGMLSITRNRDRAEGTVGGIHNGFLAVLFYYGIPALIFFTLFTVLSVVFHSQYIRMDDYFVIPFLSGIIFLVGNLTNSLVLLSDPGIIYAIHIGIGIGYMKLAKNQPKPLEPATGS